jgi:CBS-domain-containing membrane protein
VPAKPDHSPAPVLEREDVLRDALSDLLQAETRYAPVVDAQRRIAGVLSVEIVSEFLTSDEARVEEHPAAEPPLA